MKPLLLPPADIHISLLTISFPGPLGLTVSGKDQALKK